MTESGASPAVRGPMSRSGPEVPPDMPAPARPSFAEQPTQQLPVVAPPPAAPAPRVEARAVIVYEPQPRRRWGLFVFTGLIVSLTVGVVLGQTAAYQPPARATTPVWPAAAEAVPSPPAAVVPGAVPPGAVPPAGIVPGAPTLPAAASAPRNAARTGRIEVTGAADLLQVRTTGLGDLLYSATAAGTLSPVVTETPDGPQITLAVTGPGLAEIQLHEDVRWTVRLTGSAHRQDADLRAGGLAGLELGGGATHATVQLPRPAGRTKVTVTGAIADLRLGTGGVPARLRLADGAASAAVGGRTRTEPKPGTTLSTPGWQQARKRYDVEATARLGTVVLETTPSGR